MDLPGKQNEEIEQSKTELRCKTCFSLFSNIGNLNHHILDVHNPDAARIHKCEFCTKSYKKRLLLDDHIAAVHQGKRKYGCRICNATFTCMGNRGRHEKSVHGSQEKKFKCTQCSRAYLNEANLKRHFKTHTGIKEFVCLECNDAFFTKCELKRHNLKHSRIKDHKCHICNAAYGARGALKQHLANKHNIEKIIYSCNRCQKTFISPTGLKRHKLTHDIENKKHGCSFCRNTFYTKIEVNYHEHTKHGNGSTRCCRCNFSFKSSHFLEQHDKMFNGSMLACQRCDKKFCIQTSLDRHNKRAHSTKCVAYDKCEKTFHTQHGLDVHVKMTHSRASNKGSENTGQPKEVELKDKMKIKQTVLKRIKCGTCEAEFCKIGGLMRHLKNHPKPYLFECIWCRKKYMDMVAFKKHLSKVCKNYTLKQNSENMNNKNAGEKNEKKKPTDAEKVKKLHSCQQCQRTFKSHYQLNRHLPSHDMNTYPCTICKKILSSKLTLRRHVREHKRPRLFKCKTCQKSFKQRSHLKAHFLTHLGIRQLSCSVCHIRFVQKGTRDRHERAHSGTNEFACQKCNKTFRRQDSLKCHLAKSCTQKEVTNAHKCNICFASYRYKNALMYHRRTVHNNKPPKYRCDVCATTFRDRHILKRHMMIHKASNDRPSFNCSLCSVTFTSKTTLKMHYKAVHLDIKDHECHTCNKRFSTGRALTRHMLTHDEHAPRHKCPKCSASFSRKDHLGQHLLKKHPASQQSNNVTE